MSDSWLLLLTDGMTGRAAVVWKMTVRRQTAMTNKAGYRKKLIQVRRRHTIQHTVRHQRQLEIDSFWHTQPVQYCEGVSEVIVATKSEHQTSCSIEYSLKASLEVGRKPDEHEVAVVEPGVDERNNEKTKTVVGDVST